MTNLIKLPKSPSFKYDWSSIEDGNQRSAAKSAVEAYEKIHHQNRASVQGYIDAAAQKIEGDNAAKARCVYNLKLTLPHGSFLEVCEKALSIKSDNATALATSGKILIEEGVSAVEEQMVSQMAPQAGSKFLRSEPETKNRYVTVFEETGNVPSQRDLRQDKSEEPVPPVSNPETFNYQQPVVFDVTAEPASTAVVERLDFIIDELDSMRKSRDFDTDEAQKKLKLIHYRVELMLGLQTRRY